MAIRDSFVYPIADGDQLNDGYFNSLPLRLILSDTTASSLAQTATNLTTTAVSVNIPANSVEEFLLLNVVYSASPTCASGTSECYMDFWIGSPAVLSKTTVAGYVSGGSVTVGTQFGHNDLFVYAPTAGEISGGFTIKIKYRTANTGSSVTGWNHTSLKIYGR